jgi:hypothetical protein
VTAAAAPPQVHVTLEPPQVSVPPPRVTLEAPPPPDVHVVVEQPPRPRSITATKAEDGTTVFEAVEEEE